VPGDFEARLVKAMHEKAERHPRWGYRMIHALLVDDGWPVNVKRIHRLWVAEGLRVPPQRRAYVKKTLGGAENSAWNLPALRPGHVWTYDFIKTYTAEGIGVRILNVLDEYTRVAVAVHVARSIGSRSVVAVLEKAFESHGRPQIIRSDNGSEFIAGLVINRFADLGVRCAFVEKASPQQNPFIEAFHASMRKELLNGELFDSVTEARVVVTNWVEIYNNDRPHRSLRMMTPAAFARVAKLELTAGSRKGST
jgi:putative transposase